MAAALTYLGNTNTGGAVPVDASSPYAEGATVTVVGNTGNLVKTGYRFTGWNTAANGSGTAYVADDTFLMPATPVDLYAQWAAVFTVTYDGNTSTGGTAPTDSSSPYAEAAEVTVLGAGTLVKTGSTFGGWNTAANGSGTTYAAGAKFSMPATAVNLYAIWVDVPDNTVLTKAVNAATFTAKRTVTAADVTNKAITFDFQTSRDMVFAVTVVDEDGAVVTTDIGVSYPAAGQVRVYGTGTAGAGLVAGQIISIVGSINCADPAFKV